MNNFTQCLESFNDIENLRYIIESATNDIEQLENIKSIVEKTDESKSSVTNEIATVSIEAICKRLGVENTSSGKRIATEGFIFHVNTDKVIEFIKRIWEAIVKAFKKVIEFIKKLFGFSSNTVDDSNEKLRRAKNKGSYDDVEFTYSSSKVDIDFDAMRKELEEKAKKNKAILDKNNSNINQHNNTQTKSEVFSSLWHIENKRLFDIFFQDNRDINNIKKIIIMKTERLKKFQDIGKNISDFFNELNKIVDTVKDHPDSELNFNTGNVSEILRKLLPNEIEEYSYKNITRVCQINTLKVHESTLSVDKISVDISDRTKNINKHGFITISLTEQKALIPYLEKLSNQVKILTNNHFPDKVMNYIEIMDRKIINNVNKIPESLLQYIKYQINNIQKFMTQIYAVEIKEAVEIHYTTTQMITQAVYKVEPWSKR